MASDESSKSSKPCKVLFRVNFSVKFPTDESFGNPRNKKSWQKLAKMQTESTTTRVIAKHRVNLHRDSRINDVERTRA